MPNSDGTMMLAPNASISAAENADRALTRSDLTLLAELGRLRKAPRGFRAAHILSSVVASRPKFKNEIEAACQVVQSILVTGSFHKIFNLSNGDIVFIYSQVTTSSIIALCTSLETSLFVGVKSHRNVYGDFGNYKIFDLSRDVNSLIDGIRETISIKKKAIKAKQPISIKIMEYMISKIRESNIRSIVFNQPVYNISHRKSSIEFLEFYTSIEKLEQLFAPDMSISGNPWLFNLIKRELDAAVMRAIGGEIPSYRHKAFSINLQVESFMSDGFREFIDSLPVKLGGRIFVEIEKTDLVQHSEFLADIFARGENMNVPLCIDGISHHDVELLRLSRVRCHFVKMKWSPDILKLPEEEIAVLIDDLKASAAEVILTRCDTPNSLSFARAAGINYIQGHLADDFFRSGETLQ
jgi:EAL domain-containing protein (putative c-di-GMP-specific phosphodiesterase class I)